MEDIVVLKIMIFDNSYIEKVWWSCKHCILPLLTVGACGGLEWMHFRYILLWNGVVVLKGLILDLSLFGFVKSQLIELQIVVCLSV